MQTCSNPASNEAAKPKVWRKNQSNKPQASATPAKSRTAKALKKPTRVPAADVDIQHSTKQDLVLSMLRRREGATVTEIVTATDWQKHSVRGFLAGIVKKKLGFRLVSSKEMGKFRRYRIDARGR